VGCEFSLGHYRELLRTGREGGYRFAFFEAPPAPGDLIVRHDVDLSLEAAVEMAELEAEEGVATTYLLMTRSVFYNLGGAGLFGLALDVTRRLELQAAGLLGSHVGGYGGASLAIVPGKLRPILSAGVPIFWSNGARYSVRGAGGVEIEVSRHLTLIAEIGVEHLLNPEPMLGAKPVLVVPAIGAAGRL